MKFIEVFRNIYGWIITACLMLWSFIGNEQMTFIIVGICILFDLFWGVFSAIKRKTFIYSEILRETPKKVLIYGGSLLIVYMIERNIHEEYLIGTKVIGSIMAACELWSASANMLIIKPDMPFIKLFQKQLKGEIQSKTGVDVNDILTDKK
jgi:hypothetical protein